MRRSPITILLIIVSVLTVEAQITFEKVWWTTNLLIEEGWYVEQTVGGGYIVLATEIESVSQNPRGAIHLAEIDEYGNIVWSKEFWSSYDNDMVKGFSGAITQDGGYAIAGCVNCYENPPNAKSEFLLIRTNSQGDSLWSKTYGRDKRCWANWVEPAADGGFVLTGYGAATSGSADVWVVKTDSLGNKEWDKAFQLYGEDRGWCVRQTSEGGYIVVGTSQGGNTDVMIIKLDNMGNTMWSKNHPGGTWGVWGRRYYEIQQTNDGGYALVGQINGGNFAKLDSTGNMQWTKLYNQFFSSVQQLSDDSYIITGVTYDYDSSGDLLLFKADANGDSVWAKNFGVSGWTEIGNFVRATSDVGYIITGYSDGGVLLIKTNSNGDVVGINDLIGTANSKVRVYPNPFRDHTFIYISPGVPVQDAILSIYNLLGKKIRSIENINSQKIRLEHNNLKSGVYFYKLFQGNETLGQGRIIVE